MSGSPPSDQDAAQPADGPATPLADPETLARRARIDRLVRFGKRYGYGLFAYAVVAFVVGAVIGFSVPLVDPMVVAMLVGSIPTMPSIVFGYGLRAAERDDRERAAAAARRRAARSRPDPGQRP
jgi:hypothetical protein